MAIRTLKLGKTHSIQITENNVIHYFRTDTKDLDIGDLLHVANEMAIELYEARKLLKAVYEAATGSTDEAALNRLYPQIKALLTNKEI